ncbi:MAG: heat-inducible transcription repressor HrcA [Desulfuromonas sp.]|nr:MAG: heat-inducible transcription repressor HrcA [Desulfuromonas sp.]
MATILSARNQDIFKAVVELHIETAGPVSSQAVTRRLPLKLSPATVRNVMAELEANGLIHAPHTSAGRIPTDVGYQFYVNALLHNHGLSREEQQQLRDHYLLRGLGMDEALQRASRVLSELSCYTGMVMAPSFSQTIFRHIDFHALPGGRVLVILVSESGIVENRVISVEEPVRQAELDQAANYLNTTLSGLSMAEAQMRILQQMVEEKTRVDVLVRRALRLSREALKDELGSQVFIEGTTQMLEQPEFADLETMKRLLRAFEQKSLLVALLDRSRKTGGTQVCFGSDSGIAELSGCSLITASFTSGRGATGTIGIIGPVRMPYAHVIPLVDCSARLISQMLKTK